jgi:hypothetical protein
MHCTRSIQHVDEMIELARRYCARLAAYRADRASGALSEGQDSAVIAELAQLDARIELLKRGENLTTTPRPKRSRGAVRFRRMFRRLTR